MSRPLKRPFAAYALFCYANEEPRSKKMALEWTKLSLEEKGVWVSKAVKLEAQYEICRAEIFQMCVLALPK